MEQITPKGRVTVFGEVLFDVFPNGKEILGGAPLNVAWHLQAFGFSPLLISRVGNDERGKLIKETIQDWGMDTQGLQTDSVYPTGIVNISHENSEPKFRIEPNQAYDHIALNDTLINLKSSLLLHGTLALRSPTSYKTLSTLREKSNIPVFADLNRRPPWWKSSIVKETLGNASWVKVNEQELHAISQTRTSQNNQCQKLATQLMEQYKNIKILFVTLGVKGAFALTRNGETFSEKGFPLPATELDTVGAGDAFIAVAIIGILEDWNINILLQRANSFAAAVCRIPGATTINQNLYQNHLKAWATK